MKKTKKIVWLLDLIFFIGVVVMAINQAGIGAEIHNKEEEIRKIKLETRQISENVLKFSDSKSLSNLALELGFDKPNDVVYIDSLEILSSNILK